MKQKTSFYYLIMIFSLLIFTNCDSQTINKNNEDLNNTYFSFLGGGAKETEHYFFKNRDINTVEIYFYEPFIEPPKVITTSKMTNYQITNISNWGFKLEIIKTGFWKDTKFNVSGILANGQDFCLEEDQGIDPFIGARLFTLQGIFQDICDSSNESLLEEQYCENNTLQSKIIECEKNCFSKGGPGVCTNGTNVKQDCFDPTPGIDYYTTDFVMSDGMIFEDYCFGQIHGTKKELSEMTCDQFKLKEINKYCDFGCVGGRCLLPENLIIPELTFGVLASDNSSRKVVDFRGYAEDDNGMKEILLFEQNATKKIMIYRKDCEESTLCNFSVRLTDHKDGVYIFESVAKNFYNNTASKNITLNFSGDLSPPIINITATPQRFNITNFTTIDINASDNSGLLFINFYKQPIDQESILLTSWSCKEKTECNKKVKLRFNESGYFNLIASTTDTQGNSAMGTKAIEIREVNETTDKIPPNLTFSINVNETFAGYYITVNYEASENQKFSRIGFYKKERNGDWEYVSGLECGNKTHCSGEFIYKNEKIGKFTYLINVSDTYANYISKEINVNYKELPNSSKIDESTPEIVFTVNTITEGVIEKTLLEYSSTDTSPITYMNLYEHINNEYRLVRTKFCKKETSCEASLVHDKISTNTTFLIIAVDLYGNKGELKRTTDGTSIYED